MSLFRIPVAPESVCTCHFQFLESPRAKQAPFGKEGKASLGSLLLCLERPACSCFTEFVESKTVQGPGAMQMKSHGTERLAHSVSSHFVFTVKTAIERFSSIKRFSTTTTPKRKMPHQEHLRSDVKLLY